MEEQEYLDENLSQKHSVNQVEIEFFSTNDKFFKQLDCEVILEYINKQYPKLNVNNTNQIIKKTIIEILNNKKFLNELLYYFNIDIFDFFKMLCKDYGNLFKGPFLKKIQTILKTNNFIKDE